MEFRSSALNQTKYILGVDYGCMYMNFDNLQHSRYYTIHTLRRYSIFL